jgi:citrate synthase
MSRPPGPIETYPWPKELRGNVTTPGHQPRIHGYDVEEDLARNYRYCDVVLLALTGELPSEEQSIAFDTALMFLAPVSVAEAPTHVAVLAHITGSRSSAILGVSAIALAERARFIVAESAPLLEWLAAPGPPFRGAATGNDDLEAVERLRAALRARNVRIDALSQRLSRQEAVVATLWFAGLTRPDQLEAALVLASLPAVAAEARFHPVASFREYPMQLPPYHYEDP